MEAKNSPSKRATTLGWILSLIPILFLLFDSTGKLMKPEVVVQGTLDLGYPESAITGIGIVLLICTILYAVPRFSFAGAVLLTGYLGGAIATHVRVENPVLTHILFPVYVGIFIWGGLYLRNKKLRAIVLNKKM